MRCAPQDPGRPSHPWRAGRWSPSRPTGSLAGGAALFHARCAPAWAGLPPPPAADLASIRTPAARAGGYGSRAAGAHAVRRLRTGGQLLLGNGHATLWRGLATALARAGHRLTFFERDQPWYAAHRDLTELPAGELVLHRGLETVAGRVERALGGADVAMVTSFCPDGPAAVARVLASRAQVKAFYDLDPGATLERLERGRPVEWLGPEGLAGFDLVLSYSGGGALALLRDRLGARRVEALHGWVDPEVHRPAAPLVAFTGDLSYLGTWAASRQAALEALFLAPAARRPDRTFVLAGAQYGADFPWRANVRYVRHLEPALHPAFFCSSPLTLSVTRPEMAALGACPSARLFEAAACGVPVLTDWFEGLPQFFTPDEEILVARTTEDVLAALARSPASLARMGARARERTLAEHTAAARVGQLVTACQASAGAAEAPAAGGAA
ncbi:MAG: glycosyltransferase [Anaeromyxobacter sp.]